MTIIKDRPSSKDSSVYPIPFHGGLITDEYIDIASTPAREKDVASEQSAATRVPSPFSIEEPIDHTGGHLSFWQRHWKDKTVLKYLLSLITISIIFIIPVFSFHSSNIKDKKKKDLEFYLSLWLLITWACACVCDALINVFPYIFRFIAASVNPGHVKYWRIFWFMRLPVVFLGASIGSYISFWFLVKHNSGLVPHKEPGPKVSSLAWEDLLKRLLVNANRKLGRKSENPWQEIMDNVLSTLIVWAVIYFLEKVTMLFIAIHYHYRADGNRIEKSKRIRKALAKLYDASTSIHPFLQGPFASEDAILRHSKRSKGLNGTFLSVRGYKNMSSNLIVDHALEESRSSAALARRIWLSLVPEGHETLEMQDVIEVFGPGRKSEAEEVFSVIDENENGDVTLNEMILIVVDVGRTRSAVYQGMTDINRAINVLDWICCILVAMAIVIYAVIRYVPGLKGLKDAAGITALGLTWGLGRTIHEFLNGCIFIFFKHAYDVGDRIEVYNIQSTVPTSVIVTRISILFTVFRRVDNGKDLQMSNDRLNLKRIENVTRSGANRETVPVFVDANTTFTDIQFLKSEISTFLSAPANSRDYKPTCSIRIHSIHELQKLELRIAFTHKSNWANEDLRAARSSKFMCFLVSAIRRIPIVRPNGYGAGLPPRRLEPVREREEEAFEELSVVPVTQENSGRGVGVGATGIDIGSTTWAGQRVRGLRRRNEGGGFGSVPYGPS